MNSCSASAPASVITVTDSGVPEPAMAVLHTIAFSGDDGAEAGDDLLRPRSIPSRSTRHRTSWRSSRRRASLQRLRLRLRTLGCASFAHVALSPRSRRRRPDRHATILDVRCGLSGSLLPLPTTFSTKGH